MSPAEGSTAGGTIVTISGANFSEAGAVHFGSVAAASFKVESSSTITAVSPPGHGVVHITVQSPYGTSLESPQDRFKYIAGGSSGSTATETGAGSTGTGSVGVLSFGSSSTVGCGVTLLSKKLAVLRSRVLVKLRGAGVGRCAGKLRLRVKLPGAHRHVKIKTIGTAVFAVSSGKSTLVRIKLNSAGRTLLSAGHGRLNASLLLVKSSPAPLRAKTASVRLSRKKLIKVAVPKK
ncbi:MAG: IPT/TIG domain-containing protein [Solirubrobacteraceae bacterium]